MRTYKETLAYMFEHLPLFQRVGNAAYKANLDNTLKLCNALDNPQNKFKTIHIAGTNGKGSTSHMLAAAFQQAGYKTGLYTSPHLKDFRERIKINGKKISRAFVIQFIEQNQEQFEIIKPSFFEMTVGMAFQYFKEKGTEIAIIETGLGGRLDSTNVIKPLLSIITNISKDHTALLGNTRALIAQEKAGIIKSHTPIIIGETQPEVKKIFIQTARQMEAPIYFADKNFSLMNTLKPGIFEVKHHKNTYIKHLKPQLKGFYQSKNIVTVLQGVQQVNELGFFINKKQVKEAIEKVCNITGLQGRWEILQKKPLCIADTGHNEAGIKVVLKQLKETPYKQLHIVLGMVNDKDISKILSMLPKKAIYYFCKAAIPRGTDAHELALKAADYGLSGKTYKSVKEAFMAAKKKATSKDLVFVGGSTFTVAEVI